MSEHPQYSDVVTAEGLQHIDNCDQCRQTYNVQGRIVPTEHKAMATQLAQAWCICGQVHSASTLAGAKRRLNDHIQGLPAQVDYSDTYTI